MSNLNKKPGDKVSSFISAENSFEQSSASILLNSRTDALFEAGNLIHQQNEDNSNGSASLEENKISITAGQQASQMIP